MANEKESGSFFNDLKQEVGDLWQSATDEWRAIRVSLRNGVRRTRSAQLDYIVMPLGGSLPERALPERSFIERQLPLPPLPFSMEQFNHRLQLIGDADNVRGVVFVLRDFSAGFASLQNVRRSIQRLQECGKEVIIYTPTLDLAHYFVASAADIIIAPPSSWFDVRGLHSNVLFLKNGLQQLGIEADVVQISPYKTAMNQLSEETMTPQHQKQMDWLMDSQFDILTRGMANGRSKTRIGRSKTGIGRSYTQDEIKELINRAPLSADDTLESGLIDYLAYEDEIADILGKRLTKEKTGEGEATEETEETAVSATTASEAATENEEGTEPEITLTTWNKARGLLTEKPRRHSKKFIGVISLEGGIVMGESQQPPIDIPLPFVGGPTAGEQTLRRLIRKAEEEDQMAALIFHVDSPGGSALSSDLIGREIERLRQKKPVLVYMGNVAASGGYYVSAPAQHIMSQSGTITGSIGVITARMSTDKLYQKLSLNRFSLKRGERADLYTNTAPMSADERQIFWTGILDIYGQFKQVVANGRQLPYEELDPICEGRVWTGAQALDHQLVDSHGDFIDAIHKAAELADLTINEQQGVPVVNFHSKRNGYIPPQPFAPAEAISQLLSGDRVRALLNQPLLMMPFSFRWWK